MNKLVGDTLNRRPADQLAAAFELCPPLALCHAIYVRLLVNGRLDSAWHVLGTIFNGP